MSVPPQSGMSQESFRLCLKDDRLSFFVCTPDAVCIQRRKLSVTPRAQETNRPTKGTGLTVP
jgi:hypothetical protein